MGADKVFVVLGTLVDFIRVEGVAVVLRVPLVDEVPVWGVGTVVDNDWLVVLLVEGGNPVLHDLTFGLHIFVRAEDDVVSPEGYHTEVVRLSFFEHALHYIFYVGCGLVKGLEDDIRVGPEI